MANKTSTGGTSEVASALRGEMNVDADLLAEAVAHINRVYVVKGLETAREIGEYVLHAFFDGNPENFHQRGSDHLTFRELAAREDLHVSHVWIWRAVSVVDQLRLLPEDIREVLPYTHHTLLLPLKNEKKKVELAKRAAEHGWSKRKLGDEVKKARQTETSSSKAGRPPLPAFVKTVRKLGKLLDAGSEAFGDIEQADELPPDQALELYRTLAGMKLQCEQLQERLQDKIGEL